jgi:hypothetical protein
MKNFALAAILFALASTAAAQVVPSSYTPLSNCSFFDSAIPGGSTAYLTARGHCNVPQAANAVAVVVAAIDPLAAGQAKLLESSLPVSTANPGLYWKAGTGATSGFLIVRLCYPAEECGGGDLALYVSASTRFVVQITGYFQPLP